MKALFRHIALILLLIPNLSDGQNNVGINTREPDLSAVAHIQDSVRGFLLPRTDTQSVWNFVNTYHPTQGIAHGLMIYETNLQTIYYYNGIKQKWEPITDNYGARGPTGPTGPRGPLGPMGISTQWRDSALLQPIKKDPRVTNIPPYFTQLGDTCGDFYHQTATGLIWNYNCDSNRWEGPIARWRNLGYGLLNDIRTLGLIEYPMAPDTTQDTLQLLGNLTYEIEVPPDTVAHVWVTTEGVVQKGRRNDTAFNKMVFDFWIVDSAGMGSYAGNRNVVTIGPNFLVAASNFSQFDKVPWRIHMARSFEGRISPAGSPLPKTEVVSYFIETHAGHHWRPDNPQGSNGRVTLSDGGASANNKYEAYANMKIYIIYERSQNAPNPQ